MKDPIDHLLADHREIMADVAGLRRAVAALRDRGEEALPAALPALRSVGRMMSTRLLRHARKEDEVLFPAIERALGSHDGPTFVMREEHRAIHDQVRLFKDTLRELNEVEHPAIVSGGAALRALAEGSGSAAALVETGEEIIGLLDLHFGKEEGILFPMARSMLSEPALSEIARGIDAIEAAGAP